MRSDTDADDRGATCDVARLLVANAHFPCKLPYFMLNLYLVYITDEFYELSD